MRFLHIFERSETKSFWLSTYCNIVTYVNLNNDFKWVLNSLKSYLSYTKTLFAPKVRAILIMSHE